MIHSQQPSVERFGNEFQHIFFGPNFVWTILQRHNIYQHLLHNMCMCHATDKDLEKKIVFKWKNSTQLSKLFKFFFMYL